MADRDGVRPAAGPAPTAAQRPAARPRVLPRACAITFYNAADALVPPGPDGAPGAGDLDLLPAVERRLLHEGPGAARRVGLWLVALEWAPLLRLRDRRRFSRLPHAQRRSFLGGWLGGRCAPRRRAMLHLRALVEEALASAGYSSDGA
jgi:hypothetical protein